MDLREALSQVESFCRVLTLKQLLEHVGLLGSVETADKEVQEFCETTLVLVEKEIKVLQREKKQVSFEQFLAYFEPLLGSKKLNINDFLADRYEKFPASHIQRKDIVSRSEIIQTARPRPSYTVSSTS